MNVETYFDTMSYAPALESDDEARQWLASHADGFGHFIDGAFTVLKAETLEVIEPATGQALASVSQGDAADVDLAVQAATDAQNAWASCCGHERAKILYALARLVQRHSRLIAVIEALNSGKPLRETRDVDIPLAIRHLYYHAGWAQLQSSQFADYDPVGVVGQVIPWNFPFLMLIWKIAPALALGNTVVLKPAEHTPLTALLFAELLANTELPNGVFNVVTGNGATGALLVEHSAINKVAFTGSTHVGKWIREKTAGSGKSLTLELGGKSPFIIFDDADLDASVEGVVDAIWFNQGQVCCAGSRILVQEGVAEEFHRRLKRRMEKLRLGSPLDKCIDMGSLVSDKQLQRVRSLVELGVSEGASLFQPSIPMPEAGSFYPPTLLSNVQPTDTVACDEIFGPVVVSMSFRTFDEAIELANHSRYGLAASIWSESVNQALDVAASLSAGVVWINTTNALDAGVGFGGKKESGFGREGGREGCFEYLRAKLWAKGVVRAQKTAIVAAPGVEHPPVDRTAKMFIGGKQQRPDSGYSISVLNPSGVTVGDVGKGSRKDIRNAVEAARKAGSWASKTTFNRAQILYYIAENLSARADEFAARISTMTGKAASKSQAEVDASISRLFTYGAWADKYEGAVHLPPIKGVALAMPEPLGVVGVLCPPEAPLLGLISLAAPLIATGNRVVLVPSEVHPLCATDFYQVLETSDLPAGVLNIVTGSALDLAITLSKHNDVDAVWAFGSADLSRVVEKNSAGNLKRTWVDYGRQIDWLLPGLAEGEEFLRHATEIKNIWLPYGE